MRTLILAFLFLFSPALWGKEEVKAFIEALSRDQKSTLTQFLQFLVKDSFSGYVLYGDKPICIEACPLDLDYETDISLGASKGAFILGRGIELWSNLNIPVGNKEYLFIVFDVDYGYRHMICIHRKAFLQVVNENLSLFRYILSPTLTAEELLNTLIEAKQNFYQVLKNDNVLLGILLGYGKQNALLVSRKESITDSFAAERKEDFPFISRKTRMESKSLPKMQKKRPSLGFSSLAQEHEAITKLTTVSRRLKPFATYKIPYFGCDPQTEESKALLSTYEKNRQKIINICQKESFLEETLSKLFTTTSKTIEIPPPPDKHFPALPKDQQEVIAKVVKAIHDEMRAEKHFSNSFPNAFSQGVRDRENGKEISNEELAWDLYSAEKALECVENLDKANAYFDTLATHSDLATLVPQKVYHKLLHPGNGPSLSRKAKTVSFHYTCHLLPEEESSLEMGTVKEESLEHLIPGIAQSLIGMKRGEEREIYIHPQYGYGEDSYLPPNISIRATIQLIDFEEGEIEIPLAAPHQVEERNHKQLLEKYEHLRKKELYQQGFSFWDALQKNHIEFSSFEKLFNQDPSTDNRQSQNERFSKDLCWHFFLQN